MDFWRLLLLLFFFKWEFLTCIFFVWKSSLKETISHLVLFKFFFFFEIVSWRDDFSLLNFFLFFILWNRLLKRRFISLSLSLSLFVWKSSLQETIYHIKSGILEIVSWKDDFFIIFFKIHKSSFEENFSLTIYFLFPIRAKLR